MLYVAKVKNRGHNPATARKSHAKITQMQNQKCGIYTTSYSAIGFAFQTSDNVQIDYFRNATIEVMAFSFSFVIRNFSDTIHTE